MEASTGEEITEGHNLAVVKQHWETNAMDVKLADGSTMTSLRSMAPVENIGAFSCMGVRVEAAALGGLDVKLADGSTMTCLSPIESGALACLGVSVGAASLEGFVNHVDPNTEYGKLPRPDLLPGSCPISVEDLVGAHTEFVFKWIQKFWNGDFIFKFCCPDPEMFWLKTALDNHPNAPIVHISIENKNGKWSVTEQVSGSITAALDEDVRKQELLTGRVLSHFMRCCGWNVPATLLPPTMEYLIGVFKGKKFLKTKLDLCILHADLILNFHGPRGSNSTAMVRSMIGAAEALEALGGFDAASGLYWEGSQYAATSSHPEPKLEASCYDSAGLACKRAGRPHEAVEHSLKAIQVSSQGALSWNSIIQHEQTNVLFCNLLVREKEVHDGLMHTRAGTGPFWINSDEKVFVGIMGLASLAMFEPFPACHFFKSILERFRAHPVVDCFRPEYRQPKKARKALVRIIFCSSTFQDYKEGILRTLQKGFMVEIPKDAVPRQKTEKDFMKDARKNVKARPAKLPPICLACELWPTEMAERSLMWCPCKAACYCSKACQRSDWKNHKLVCRWHKAKSQPKTSKQG